MRDRLIELLNEARNKYLFVDKYNGAVADYLLANGVMVPPCRVKQTVYVPNSATRSVDEYKVFAMHNYGNLWTFSATRTDDKITYTFDEGIVGDNVFLTKEEAEKALKGGAE